MVDVQNCFVDGGTLPVKGGAEVVPVINQLAAAFENIVVTQDWHTPAMPPSPAATPGKKPFETSKLGYGKQVLWPDHCVQGTDDAALHKDLKLPTAQLIIRKGFHKDIDSYSAFEEADRKTPTGLAGYLKAARHQDGVRHRPGHRLLRGLDRARRAQGRLRGLCDRGRHPRHRPQRLARRGVEADGGQGRQAHPVRRHPGRLSRIRAHAARFALTVNGHARSRSTVPREATLLHVLRNDLALNGPKYGCGLGQCGACTVWVDGVAARACVIPAHGVAGRAITTLEGLGTRGRLAPGAAGLRSTRRPRSAATA